MLCRQSKLRFSIVLFPSLLALHSFAQTQQAEGLQQAIQRVQLANADNQKRLHSYQWIETTTATINGTSRPPKQSICKYAPDGSVQKTPIGEQGTSSGRQGGPLVGGLIRGIVAKDKKEKYQKEAQQVRALAGLYIPLSGTKFAVALQDGRVSLDHDGTEEDIVIIDSYAKPGDQMRVTLNHATARIVQISVKSYFDKPSDVLTGEVQFSEFGDGTSYPSMTTINAPSMKLSISIANSDYSRPAE